MFLTEVVVRGPRQRLRRPQHDADHLILEVVERLGLLRAVGDAGEFVGVGPSAAAFLLFGFARRLFLGFAAFGFDGFTRWGTGALAGARRRGRRRPTENASALVLQLVR